MKMAVKRLALVVLGFVFQIALSLALYLFLINLIEFQYENIIYNVIGICLIIFLVKDNKNYSYNMPWIILILLFPLIGTLLYIIIGNNRRRSRILKKIKAKEKDSIRFINKEKIDEDMIGDNNILKYLNNHCKYPISNNSNISYYKSGEEAYPVILEELSKAKNFIFLEYFIINHGKMWNSVLKILEEKVKKGVDVRVMYDDFGCIKYLKSDYYKELEEKGIKCVVFNKLNPFAGIIMNNRDHRKILVIDGKVAFSGGINIADEYINVVHKYGYWKDNAIKVTGDSVYNFTHMFLTIWNSFRNEDKDFNKYRYEFDNKITKNNYILPYNETPLDKEDIAQDIYLNIINQANNYVYIFTPYLIIDNDIIKALSLAVKKGVDVRIVIPGIPDKKTVYTLTESYASSLIKNNIKIYKYKKGFIHSKVFVSDDKIATVGTINLDYRSLYLSFECGCYIENDKVIQDIKDDLTETIKRSKEITKKEANPGFIKGVWQAILRLIAPLL